MSWIPQDPIMEKSIVGEMLMNKDSAIMAASRLKPSDFYFQQNEDAFRAITEILKDRRTPDAFTLRNKLVTMGHSQEMAESYMMSAIDGFGNGLVIGSILDQCFDGLRDMAMRRDAIKHALEMQVLTQDPSLDTMEVLDLIQVKTRELALQSVRGKALVSFREGTKDTLKWIEDMEAGAIQGLITGMLRWDRFFGPLQGGDLMVIGARPSMGKTSLGLAVGLEAARLGQGGAFFTMEMRRRELMLRAYCRERNLDIATFRNQTASTAERAFLREAAMSMRDLPLYFDDTARRTPMQIQAGIRQLMGEQPVKFAVIDYLTMMRGDGKFENRRHELSYCARACKDMAGELDIPVILLSQLTRRNEHEDREPTSSDLRETGEIEEAADMVVLIDRPIMRTADADPRFAKLIVPKFRNGPTGWLKMTFEARCAGFFNWIEPQFLEGIPFPKFAELGR